MVLFRFSFQLALATAFFGLHVLAGVTQHQGHVRSNSALAPTVTPGPGLPSLESLGITSENLYDEAWIAQNAPSVLNSTLLKPRSASSSSSPASPLHRRASWCSNSSAYMPSARACLAYLDRLGTTQCTTNVICPTRNPTIFCSSECFWIWGCGRAGRQPESSYCTHVASGGQVILRDCPPWNESTDYRGGGEDVAWGNGNLLVGIWGC
jgi:hypothetical protein